ncbi:MAG: hypothetical protein JWQ57_224 [Mucilaginibacter sp.]|nr:hypothetical protein [Mucilaginibacter sp.]
MNPIHLNKGIIAEIPDNWKAEITQGLISLFDPINGLGVMQFSFYIIKNAYSLNLVDELEEYLKDKYEGANANLIDDFAYFDIVSSSGIFWRYWLLRKKTNIIFVSYNCAKEDIGKEDNIVDNIIRSIN